MNIEVKFLSKRLANWTQQYTKSIIHLNQVRFIPGVKDYSIYTNQSMQ